MKPILKYLFMAGFSCLLGIKALAGSQITIFPGNEILVQAGDSILVRCDGNSNPTKVINCECVYNGGVYGEAIAQSNHDVICKRIMASSAPRNCQVIATPVRCGCVYNGGVYGEVTGSSDLDIACKRIMASSAPRNCRPI